MADNVLALRQPEMFSTGVGLCISVGFIPSARVE